MTASGWARALSPLGWLLLLAALVLLMFIAWLILRDDDSAARAKAGAIVGDRNASAGRDAVGVVTGNAAAGQSIDQSVKEGTDAIRQAPEDQRNPASLRALCLRDAHRRDPACRELR